MGNSFGVTGFEGAHGNTNAPVVIIFNNSNKARVFKHSFTQTAPPRVSEPSALTSSGKYMKAFTYYFVEPTTGKNSSPTSYNVHPVIEACDPQKEPKFTCEPTSMLSTSSCVLPSWEPTSGSYQHDIQDGFSVNGYLDPSNIAGWGNQQPLSSTLTTHMMSDQLSSQEFNSNLQYFPQLAPGSASTSAVNTSVRYPESSQRSSQRLELYSGPSFGPFLGRRHSHPVHPTTAERNSQNRVPQSPPIVAGFEIDYATSPTWSNSYDPSVSTIYSPHDSSHTQIIEPATNALFSPHPSPTERLTIDSYRFPMTHGYSHSSAPIDDLTPPAAPFDRFPSLAEYASGGSTVVVGTSPIIDRSDAVEYFGIERDIETSLHMVSLDQGSPIASSSIHHRKVEHFPPLDVTDPACGVTPIAAPQPWTTAKLESCSVTKGAQTRAEYDLSLLSADNGAAPSAPRRPKKRSKMHECEICHKLFPRPSGLNTHMNTHTDSKPFPCTFEGCSKRFAVRSNAKRHLRTHGIVPSSSGGAPAPYIVDFSAPIVVPTPTSTFRRTGDHQLALVPPRLQWIPESLMTRSNASSLHSPRSPSAAPSFSGSDEASDDTGDGCDDYVSPTLPGKKAMQQALTIPLPPAVPSAPEYAGEYYEERNSFMDAGLYPYHSSQYQGLPGPSVLHQASVH